MACGELSTRRAGSNPTSDNGVSRTGPIPVRELYIVHEKLSRAGQMRKRFWPRWRYGCTIEEPATCLGDSKHGSLDEQRTHRISAGL
jgi:hypothetical protein